MVNGVVREACAFMGASFTLYFIVLLLFVILSIGHVIRNKDCGFLADVFKSMMKLLCCQY